MKRWLALVACLLAPLITAAQDLPTLVPSATPRVQRLIALEAETGDSMSVLPIWSATNGELLAVVALPRGWVGSAADLTPAYHGPSRWQLAGASGRGAELRWFWGSGLHADVGVGRYRSGCETGCDSGRPVAWLSETFAASLGLGWAAPGVAMDFSYGLSWLQTQPSNPRWADHSWLGWAKSDPRLTGLGRSDLLDHEASAYASARWRIADRTAVHVDAGYGRGRTLFDGTAAALGRPAVFDLDQLSLSLGLQAGALRGAVVGRVLRSDDPLLAGKRWTALDLGVSWRTPWSGQLSIGARNILGVTPESPRDTAIEGEARMPYVQYRQDL